MRYRRLTPSGDYLFGGGPQDFITAVNAVGQAAQTRLTLFQGTFWRDLSDGLPFFQSIIGNPKTSASPQNLSFVDGIYKARIQGTMGATGVPSFSRAFNPATREYDFTCTLQTIYGITYLPYVAPIPAPATSGTIVQPTTGPSLNFTTPSNSQYVSLFIPQFVQG